MANSAILTIGSLAAGVFGYLFHFIISRKISVAEYGELQSLHALFLILTVGSGTLNYFFLKFFPVFAKADDRASHHAFLRWAQKKMRSIFITLSIVLLLLVFPLQYFFHISNTLGVFFIIVATLVGFQGIIYQSALIGWEYFFFASIVGIATAFGKLVAGYILVLFFPNAAAVLFSYAISACIGLCVAWLFHQRKFGKGDGSDHDWKKEHYLGFDLKKNLIHVFFFSLLLTAVGSADILLVKQFATSELTGYYGALRTLGALVLTLNVAVVGAVLPAACANGHEKKSLQSSWLFACYGLIAVISGSAAIVYAFFPHFVVGMLYGAQYTAVAADLWLFCPLAFFLSILTFEANLAYARHDYIVTAILAGTLAMMAGSVALFHSTIHDVALSVIIVLAFGAGATFVLNVLYRRKELLEPLRIEVSENVVNG